MKIKYRYVFNRKKKLNSMGEALVQIEAYQKGRKAYFGTGVYVKPQEWRRCEVVGRCDAALLNGTLQECLMRLQTIELQVWRGGGVPSLVHLRKQWRMKASSMRFSDFARDVIEHSARRQSTKRGLLNTVGLLEKFRKVDICDMNYSLLKEFEEFLRSRGNHQNTIVKNMHNLRTICGEAVRRGLMTRDAMPFEDYQIRSKPTEHTTLTPAELKRMAGVTVHAKVRDAFLFCCRTGLRYSDYVRLKPEWFHQRGNTQWLELRMQKTGNMVRLPLTQLSRLLGEAGAHPHIGNNSRVNDQLREIAEKAGVKKRVTFHVARHTFATLLLGRGVPITTVQTLLGHTSVSTTQRYAEVKTSTLLRDLSRVTR